MLLQAVGRRYYAAPAEELAKRYYAINESEYNTVITSLAAQRRSSSSFFYLIID